MTTSKPSIGDLIARVSDVEAVDAQSKQSLSVDFDFEIPGTEELAFMAFKAGAESQKPLRLALEECLVTLRKLRLHADQECGTEERIRSILEGEEPK